MKILKIVTLILTIFLVGGITYAGDLGGGGSSKLELTEAQKALLLNQGTQEAALNLWVNQLDSKAKTEVYKKVFESHILPQLISK